jgi:intracellular multiplication protein IcmO
MTGARDVLGPQKNRLSNTLNPFADGSSSMLTNLIVSLMDSSSSSSDGDMWKGRAISFVEALMKLLTYSRDQGYILLDANSIRYYFTLDKLEEIVIDKRLPRYNQESIDIADAPPIAVEPVHYYCASLPGFSFDSAKKGKQTNQCQEQHGFIIMQLTRAFTSLADTYGHILRTNLAEVDLHDVVLNRRILAVLLPALEKSPDELANLGKVIIATLKAMMASGLGSELEGDYRDLILRKPTNADTPFLCILDEYGYYAVEGFAVVPAQARSLGFSAIFAGQDLPAFQKTSKEEAMSIGANTNIKICMKLEDPLETWEFFQKTAGEAYVTKVDHFQTNADSITNVYQDTRSSSYEKRSRIDLLDLKDQGLGEAHIFFKSRIVRAKTFFANPRPVKRMRLNQLLRVEPPKDDVLEALQQRFERFNTLLTMPVLFDKIPEASQEIAKIVEVYHDGKAENLIKKGVAALLGYHNRHRSKRPKAPTELSNPQEMNIFTGMRSPKKSLITLLTDNLKAFAKPILRGETTIDQIEAIERVSGKPADVAATVAAELSKDIQSATHYPPQIENKPTAAELAGVVYTIAEGITRKVQEQKAAQENKNKEQNKDGDKGQ